MAQSNNTLDKNYPIISKTYVHHFRYTISKDLLPKIKDTLFLTSNYDRITGVTPTQIIPQDQSILYLKVVTPQEIIHTAKSTLELKKFGLTLKLNSTQMEKNSIFCNSGPALMANLNKETIMEELTNTNPHLTILDVYVIPPKNIQQKLVSFKITLLTQKMVSEALEQGIKAYGHFLDPSKISRAKQLMKTQCSKCNTIGHGASKCKGQMVCPHCSGNHSIKECNNKIDPPICSNCGGTHRATSNVCSYKKKFLAIPPSNNIISQIVKNPESNYSYPAPPPTTNPWFNRNNTSNNNTNDINTDNTNSNNQMNFTTLSPNRGKSVKRPNPYYNNTNYPNSSSSNSNTNDISPSSSPTPGNSISNDTSSQSQRNSGAIPKSTNVNHNAMNNSNANNNSTSNNNNTFHKVTENGNNVYINNVQPDLKPLITYNECLIMAKQFEDWPTAFTELQFAFGISPVIAIPTSLHNRMKFVDSITINKTPTLNQTLTPNLNTNINQSSNNNLTPQNCSNSNINHTANNVSNQSHLQLTQSPNNSQDMANSINNLIKSNRDAKDIKTQSKNISNSSLCINNQQVNRKDNVDESTNNTIFSLKDTPFFTTTKKAKSSIPLDTVYEHENSPNTSSSSIDGDLQIYENSNSSISSNDEPGNVNSPHTSSPINFNMGIRTRSQSQTNLNNIPASNFQHNNTKSKQ